jgi:signal transduction histidine kinase
MRSFLPGFRLKLVVTIMVVVVVLTVGGLVLAERNAADNAEQVSGNEFRGALTASTTARRARIEALTVRCLAMVRKSRIHAALEDDALDLLYVSARDELNDLMTPGNPAQDGGALHARFYRFLDERGAVIPAPDDAVGRLGPVETARLSLPGLSAVPELGYITWINDQDEAEVDEVITTPIRSTSDNRTIAALVVGFETDIVQPESESASIHRGLWIDQKLYLPGLASAAQVELSRVLAGLFQDPLKTSFSLQVELEHVPHLLLCQRLNPGSRYPAAYEVSIYSLAESLADQRRLQLQILGAGVLLISAGLVLAQMVAGRLSKPVERLAADSEANEVGRQNAEAELRLTQIGLQRAARFSADASHQLKTPVAVLRAGLQELLARDDLTPQVRAEIATLFNETHRFTDMIEDLLLLSRMDAGRLTLDFTPVDITHLVESWLDDLSVKPDDLNLVIENRLPAGLCIEGERRYTWHILVNMLENARRYNRADGVITIEARTSDGMVHLTIGNNGRAIPREAQKNIFERFHRAGASSGVPGHGLGLNLARELVGLHGGDLQLVRSEGDWTEFTVRFRLARPI